jgi:hypothetical protein
LTQVSRFIGVPEVTGAGSFDYRRRMRNWKHGR